MSTEDSPEGFRSGFVALVGRPNVGKSTILNSICGEKVTITSNKPQTTRHQVRALHTTDSYQIVFVDTPGIGKPRSALGKKLNKTAHDAKSGVDVVCFVIDGKEMPSSLFKLIKKTSKNGGPTQMKSFLNLANTGL